LKIDRAVALKNNLKKRKLQKTQRHIHTNTCIQDNIMEKIKINGGIPLKGSFKVPGSKNSALPLLVATMLSEQEVTLHNVPHLSDTNIIMDILKELGMVINIDNEVIKLDPSKINSHKSSYELASLMRASILILGPLLAKIGKAIVPLPGGCSIGMRPVDIHIGALEKMGAKISVEHGNVVAYVDGKLKGCDITFDKVSVGATENILMAATLASGTTRLINAAKEPEIIDLANLLNKMGANIEGAGTSLITINGVEKLSGATHKVIADRIQAGSYAIAALATKGDIILEDVHQSIFGDFIEKLKDAGAKVEQLDDNNLRVYYSGQINAVDVSTTPHPGFATDLQAPWMVLMSLAKGKSVLIENIFENRFNHVPELIRMGANIVLQDHTTAIINGVPSLNSAEVKATDLRAAFALLIAGLATEGETTITKLHHLDRGYVDAVKNLQKLGANIKRGVDI
jgi:UDP-N-acetylglucosamine 1-carboxyvinyltransferase